MKKLVLLTDLPTVTTRAALKKVFLLSLGIGFALPALAQNNPPTVILTAPQAADYPRGQAITLAANASDSDGRVAQVAFYSDGNLLNVDTSSPYSYIWRNATVGVHDVTAVATDNAGATTTSIARRLQVISDPPVLTLTSPTEGAIFSGQDPVLIAANASDPDGTVVKVEVYSNDFGGGLLATLTTAPYTYKWTNLTPGPHSVFVRATDNNGRSTGESRSFTVEDPTNKAIPGKIQAENYDVMSGIATEPTADTGGGQNVGYIDAGDRLDYKLTAAAGYYTVQFRVASWIDNAQFDIFQPQGLEGVAYLGTVTLPNTGGSQKWQTVSFDLPYGQAEGPVNLRLVARTNGFNLNWLNFVRQSGQQVSAQTAMAASRADVPATSLAAYPNPSTGLVHLAGTPDGTAATIQDQLGRTVLTATVRNGAIDLSPLRTGKYFVSLQTAGKVVRLPLLKQ